MTLEDWIINYKLQLKETNVTNIFEIEDVGKFILIEPKEITFGGLTELKLFDEDFHLILTKEESSKEFNYYLFNFGGKFYFTPKGTEKKPKLNLFRFIGKVKNKFEIPFTPLGIHGKYEILNGIGEYENWCKKAIFYNHNTLGISERNSLAGIISFQDDCQKLKIKPIIGEEISIKIEDGNFYIGKIYIKNENGWQSILRINKVINIDNEEKFIDEDKLLNLNVEGLFFVFGTDFPLNSDRIRLYKKSFEENSIFFQIDSVIWKNDKRDIAYLNILKNYFYSFINILPPILINDAHYLDKEEGYIKKKLNKIGGFKWQSDSLDQYYKNVDDNIFILRPLFQNDEDFEKIIIKGIENTNIISENCNFLIKTNETFLPKFDITPYKNIYNIENEEDLFFTLIEEGMKLKGFSNKQEYIDRVREEIRIIRIGGFIDYFLILYDIIKWCKEEGILTGYGRGSAGGSLIAYLLNITRIDPIKYDLLFSRFINLGRISRDIIKIELKDGSIKEFELIDKIELKNGEFILAKDLKEGMEINF